MSETKKLLNVAQANLAKAQADAKDADKAVADAKQKVSSAVLAQQKSSDTEANVPKAPSSGEERGPQPKKTTKKKTSEKK